MRRTLNFCKRNFLEMLRDPLMYIFCVGFPVVMIALFTIIKSATNAGLPIFEPTSLIPGIIMFSYTFVMLTGSLLVSKDRSSAFIIRLYTSPMKTYNFVLGYVIPLFVVGILQLVVCIATGGIVAAITGAEYFGFGEACVLMLSSLPILITCIALGILFGTVLSDKSAPGICSVFISAAGILGGAWMPLDTMGGFESFCKALPFYPTVYLGRVATGALHTTGELYTIGSGEWWVFVSMFVYMAACVAMSLIAFAKKSNMD